MGRWLSGLLALMVGWTCRCHGGEWTIGAPARVRLLNDNELSWTVRLKVLRQATSSILVRYFIIRADAQGQAFLWLLMEKARAGVDVKLMLDARGCLLLTLPFLGKDVLQEVAAAGVEVVVFNPFLARGPHLSPMQATHSKMMLVDDRYLLTGGRNITDSYMLNDRKLKDAYCDTDILVDSVEMAIQARGVFLEEFSGRKAKRIRKDLFGNWKSQSRRLARAWDAMDANLPRRLRASTVRMGSNPVEARLLPHARADEIPIHPDHHAVCPGHEALPVT